MLGFLGNLLSGGGSPASDSLSERFGEIVLPSALGEEILRATPERRTLMAAVRDRLEHLPKAQKSDLVDRVLARFALFVFDLPASESNHHAGPFGLLDHALEVASGAVLKVSETSFRVSADPLRNHRERPGWIYAAFLAALGHDLGKALDCDVELPDGSGRWTATQGPLAWFCERHGLLGTGPELWRFREGRGSHGHKAKGLEVLSPILTPEAELYVGERLSRFFEHYTLYESGHPPAPAPVPVQDIIDVVRHYDTRSAQLNYRQRREADAEVPREKNEPIASAPGAEKEALHAPDAVSAPAASILESAHELPGVSKTEGNLQVPATLDGDSATAPAFSERQGDPVEITRRMETELAPAKFLDTVHRMILQRRLSRNGLFTDVYVRADYTWIVFPRACRRLALILRLPFDRRIQHRFRKALLSLPGLVPLDADRPLVPIASPSEDAVVQAARVRSGSLFTPEELRKLGFSTFEIHPKDGAYRKLVVAGRTVNP